MCWFSFSRTVCECVGQCGLGVGYIWCVVSVHFLIRVLNMVLLELNLKLADPNYSRRVLSLLHLSLWARAFIFVFRKHSPCQWMFFFLTNCREHQPSPSCSPTLIEHCRPSSVVEQRFFARNMQWKDGRESKRRENASESRKRKVAQYLIRMESNFGCDLLSLFLYLLIYGSNGRCVTSE